jgi:predicted DNA-binding transcriptional regulator AlpA
MSPYCERHKTQISNKIKALTYPEFRHYTSIYRLKCSKFAAKNHLIFSSKSIPVSGAYTIGSHVTANSGIYPMEALLSPKTLAAALGIAEQTIYNRHATGGDLPPVVKLGRLLRFRPADVSHWLSQKQAPATSALTASLEQPVPRRRGRPTKAEQIAARR